MSSFGYGGNFSIPMGNPYNQPDYIFPPTTHRGAIIPPYRESYYDQMNHEQNKNNNNQENLNTENKSSNNIIDSFSSLNDDKLLMYVFIFIFSISIVFLWNKLNDINNSLINLNSIVQIIIKNNNKS